MNTSLSQLVSLIKLNILKILYQTGYVRGFRVNRNSTKIFVFFKLNNFQSLSQSFFFKLKSIKMFQIPFLRRFFFSTNHKDIGILHFIFAAFAGIIGTFLCKHRYIIFGVATVRTFSFYIVQKNYD